ncbi:MAG: HlyD family efflux transporter periplasmic adaptor subunit [Planctomycetota bacterium]
MLMPTQPDVEASTDSPLAPVRRRRRSMVLPEAYDERAMPSLALARSSRFARRVGRVLTISLALMFFLIAFAPWQQSVKGTGNVIAFRPGERMQTLEAPTKGRIVDWGEGIFENAHVTKGQIIARIQDLDELYVDRLQGQVEAAENQVKALASQVAAAGRNLEAAKMNVQTLQTQVTTYGAVRDGVEAAAAAQIDAAASKLTAERNKQIEVEAALTQYESDFRRQETLFNEDITSQLKYQQAKQKFQEAQAKVAQAESNVKAAEAELDSKTQERDAKTSKAKADIEYSQSLLNKANGDVAKSESEIEKATSDMQKAESELLKTRTLLARQRNQTITAPFDGFLTEIMPNQGSAVLKEGDPIAVIVPDTKDRTVQLLLDGNDAPLVQPGRHVRLQFEGWPAVQFAGWPSVAVGTFGGKVVSVDATDNGKGKYRVLVRPEPDFDQQWPSERFLRQGVRTNGWVLLEQVPLWFEIWRNMNGFPQSISTDEAGDETKGRKVPKLPKA